MPPFLVCDPQPNATKFEVELDGLADTAPTQYNPDDTAFLKYDMATVGMGSHAIRARAGNVWGWSAYSDPLDFIRQLPGVPSGLGLLGE